MNKLWQWRGGRWEEITERQAVLRGGSRNRPGGGYRWWTDGVQELCLRACPDGWRAGRAGRSGRGKTGYRWWTDGVEERCLLECPEGWRAGRVPGKIGRGRRRVD